MVFSGCLRLTIVVCFLVFSPAYDIFFVVGARRSCHKTISFTDNEEIFFENVCFPLFLLLFLSPSPQSVQKIEMRELATKSIKLLQKVFNKVHLFSFPLFFFRFESILFSSKKNQDALRKNYFVHGCAVIDYRTRIYNRLQQGFFFFFPLPFLSCRKLRAKGISENLSNDSTLPSKKKYIASLCFVFTNALFVLRDEGEGIGCMNVRSLQMEIELLSLKTVCGKERGH